MLVGTRLKASVGFYSVVIAKQAGIGPIRRQKSGGRTGAWFAGLQQLSARGPMSSSDELRLGEPGWGARLEKLVQEGKLSLEDAAKRVGQAAAAAGEHSNKRQKSSDDADNKATSPGAPVPSDGLVLGKYIGELKRVPRTGWVLRKVPERIESVAEHSFRAATLGLFLEDSSLDTHTVVSMALLHDLAESIAGDIAPGQGINDADKFTMEQNAMSTIMGQLIEPARYERVRELWNEYEARKTKEGKAVKDLDRFEMVLQANEYEERNPSVDLSEFFDSVRGKLTHPTVIGWFNEVEKRRNARRTAMNTETRRSGL